MTDNSQQNSKEVSTSNNSLLDKVKHFDYKKAGEKAKNGIFQVIDLFDEVESKAEKNLYKFPIIKNNSGTLVVFALYFIVIELLRFFAFNETSFFHFALSLLPLFLSIAAKARNKSKIRELSQSKSERFLNK